MRQSLRRSCAACAKSKLSCDLGTPRCSRCTKRNVQCVYANEPLTARLANFPTSSEWGWDNPMRSSYKCESLSNYQFGSLDPFDSHPQTRLPREHVQRLIYSFLNKIAFQYYPLDLSPTSNPFLISWWPLALGDPALFHVSLQTACLDEELLAQRGFQASELLMVDCVALLRRKVEDVSLAVQDGTMNSVITLAAIEFGKGNTKVSTMHVDGVKKLVNMRGGIASVRQTSPLTARMISWVSMLVTGQPQFKTQDDAGGGDGIPPIPEWQLELAALDDHLYELGGTNIDHTVRNVFVRLRIIFQRAQRTPLPPTRLHDLVCFVIHRLLPNTSNPQPSPPSECLRYAIILYMFIIQGTTYFSHVVVMNEILATFVKHLRSLESEANTTDSFYVWLLAIGLVASSGTPSHQWFLETAQKIAASLQLSIWQDILMHCKWILWLDMPEAETNFRPYWDAIIVSEDRLKSSSWDLDTSPSSLNAFPG